MIISAAVRNAHSKYEYNSAFTPKLKPLLRKLRKLHKDWTEITITFTREADDDKPHIPTRL